MNFITKRLFSRALTPGQIAAYKRDGYLILKNALPTGIKSNLIAWANELESLPETPGKWMKYFEVDKLTSARILCRIEDFLPYFRDLEEVSTGYI